MSQGSLLLALPSTAWPCAPPPPPLERIGATAGDSPTCLSSQGQLRIALPSLQQAATPPTMGNGASAVVWQADVNRLLRDAESLKLRAQILEARTAPECSVSEYEELCALQRENEEIKEKINILCGQIALRDVIRSAASSVEPDEPCLKPIPRLNTCVGGLLPIPRLNTCVGCPLPIRRQNACGGGTCFVDES